MKELEKDLQEYYNSLVDKNAINTDYQGFLTSREFTNGLDDAEYFVKDGTLFVYKPVFSIY